MRIAVSMKMFAALALFAGLSFQSRVVLAQESEMPRPTGMLEVLSGPTDCGRSTCYEVRVDCPAVRAPARARLKVANIESSANGTILFTTGGLGTTLYDDSPQAPRAASIVAAAESAGFQTVQLQWIDSWLIGSEGEQEGQSALACRPATVAQWVHDNLAAADASAPYCATGHSGGAAQVSYMLSHYGQESILDAIVPTGGPPMARMDLSCDPANTDLAYPAIAANIIDAGFGFLPNGGLSLATLLVEGSGPCAVGDESYFDALRVSSVLSDDADLDYPRTSVAFVFEGIDDTNAASQGSLYLDALQASGTPHVESVTVTGVGHSGPNGMYALEQGVEQVERSLLQTCRIWN